MDFYYPTVGNNYISIMERSNGEKHTMAVIAICDSCKWTTMFSFSKMEVEQVLEIIDELVEAHEDCFINHTVDVTLKKL